MRTKTWPTIGQRSKHFSRDSCHITGPDRSDGSVKRFGCQQSKRSQKVNSPWGGGVIETLVWNDCGSWCFAGMARANNTSWILASFWITEWRTNHCHVGVYGFISHILRPPPHLTHILVMQSGVCPIWSSVAISKTAPLMNLHCCCQHNFCFLICRAATKPSSKRSWNTPQF